MFRFAICLIFSVGLSGCAASRPDQSATPSLDQLAQPEPGKSRSIDASAAGEARTRALAELPAEAGKIKHVSGARAADGLRQQIVFDQAVPGLNDSAIDLRIRTSNSIILDEPLAPIKPTEAGIRSELTSQFPRMSMKVVDRPMRNTYGPYGLAVGRWDNGARCIYAWQWIDNITSASSSEAARPASVRVRLCRMGATLDQLASYVDHLQIDPAAPDRDAGSAAPEQGIGPKAPRAPTQRATRSDATAERKSEPSRAAPTRSAGAPPSHPDAALPAVSQTAPTEPPLDASLPPAAYRGPALKTSSLSTTK